MGLMALQKNDTVSIVQLYGSGKADVVTVAPAFESHGPNLITDRLTNRDQKHSLLVTCRGDAQMCGVLRSGTNLLEFHRTDHNEPGLSPASRRKKSYWTNVLNLSLKTAKQDTEAGVAQYQRGPVSASDVNIHVTSCHVVFSGRELVLHAVGTDVNNPGVTCLYCGSISMPESSTSSFAKDSPLRTVLSKCMSFEESIQSIHYRGDLLAVALPRAVLVFDLSTNSHEHKYRMVLNIPAASVSLGVSWSSSCVTITSEDDVNYLIVCRHHSPATYKFRIPL